MGHETRMGVPLKGGTEQGALSGWRKVLRFRAGVRKAAKTAFNRRVRRKVIEIDEPD